MLDPSDSLDPLLDRLGRRTPPLPGSLAPEVWKRVAFAKEPRRRSLLAQIDAIFARTSFAAAFVVGCVLLGMFLAEVRRSRVQADYDRELVRSYLRLIDPRRESGVNDPRIRNPRIQNAEVGRPDRPSIVGRQGLLTFASPDAASSCLLF